LVALVMSIVLTRKGPCHQTSLLKAKSVWKVTYLSNRSTS